MRKVIIIPLLFMVVIQSSGQWTVSGSHIYNNNTGNVGIGTSFPTSKFVVNNTSTSGYFLSGRLNDDEIAYWYYNSSEVQFSSKTGRDLIFLTNDIERFRITSSGNVGIGTSFPTSKFVVNNTGTSGYFLSGRLNDDEIAYWYYNSSEVQFSSKTGRDLIFLTNDIERIRITGSGNIGIGVSSPSEKLSVNGNVRAKKVIVTQSGWSDYVFDSSYKLKSLTELERFIAKNKHLPDIPSTKEVEEKGISVGDNQALLLKKIEELTLYIIEQNKKIENLNKRVRNFEQKAKQKGSKSF